METKSINRSTLDAAYAAKNGILHTPWVCDDSGSITPIFTPIKKPRLDVSKESYGDDYDK